MPLTLNVLIRTSDGEARAAAAARSRVRVCHLECSPAQVLDEIDRRATDQVEAHRIDHELDAIGLCHRVAILGAIGELEPEFREVLVLRDVEDLSYEEIAAITGVPDGTVKSRIHRARGQLRVLVEKAIGEKVRSGK